MNRARLAGIVILLLGLPMLWVRGAAASCLVCTCTTSATGVAFGAYDPTATGSLSSAGGVQVSCSQVGVMGVTVSYTIALSAGTSVSYVTRQMVFGTNKLGYNLYTDATHNTVWGNGAGSSTVSDSYVLAPGPATARTYQVYGRIPAGENVLAGVYSDTIIVTVTY
jgi:spore coat protein U-like protein